MALPESYPFKLLLISSAVGKIILNLDFDEPTFFEVLNALNRVWSSHLSVGPSVAIEEIWTTISGSFPCTGTDLRTFFSPAQPHAVFESVSISCFPGTLATSAARISEKSCFESSSMRGLQIVRFVSYALK